MIDYTESAREQEVGNCTYLVSELRIPIVWGSQGVGATLGKVGVAVHSWGSRGGQSCAERPWCSRSQFHTRNTHTRSVALTVCLAKGDAFTLLISHFSFNVCTSLKDGYGQQLMSVTDLPGQTHGNPIAGSAVSVLKELCSQTSWVQIPIMLFSS